MLFEISTKDDRLTFNADSKQEAFFKYLQDTPLEKLGQIVTLRGKDGKEYPFRTVPSLILLGRISFLYGLRNIQNVIGRSWEESKEVLFVALEKDSWILDLLRDNK